MRPVLTRYPGVAKWILMHGRVISENVDRFDADMRRLHTAGFGRDSALVFALIMNTAMSAIVMSDERRADEDDEPRDHAGVIAELRSTRGWAAEEMVAFIEPLTGDPIGRTRPGTPTTAPSLTPCSTVSSRYLVCDEMTAMLDASTTAALVGVVAERASAGTGVLAVSHDEELLAVWADRVERLPA
jgi:hypothetical protein